MILTSSVSTKKSKTKQFPTILIMKENVMEYFKPDEQMRTMFFCFFSVMTQAYSEKKRKFRVLLPGVEPFIAHMPLIDIPILAVRRMFVPLTSHESPEAQWESIRTSLGRS